MKTILYLITQSEFGGAQRYVFDLAKNLQPDFNVAVAFGQPDGNNELARALAQANITYYIIPHLKRNISPLNDLLAIWEIIKLIKNLKPGILHLNSSKISILGSLIRMFVGSHKNSQIRIIYTVHGWIFNEPLPVWQKWFYFRAEKFTARFKDKIICVSEYDRQIALKNKIAAAEKLITIHNGLTPINFYSREQARQILHSRVAGYELRVTSLLIGSLGNLYKTKGFEYFIKAASILMFNIQYPVSFIIIGEGAERKNLEKLITKHNLINNFILAGKINDAAKLLPAFDIYVSSSVKEGLPYTVLEAAQAGLPIVASEVGGVPDIIKHQKNGLLVKPGDAQALADKIKELLNDENLRRRLGEAARQHVQKNFSFNMMIEATKKIYI